MMSVPLQEGFNREQAAACIVPGKILYLKVCFPHENAPHNKYFVVVGLNRNPLLLKINSKNEFSQRNKNLRENQFRLKSSVYDFLKYDSYLDCGTVWHFLSQNEIMEQLVGEPKRIVGNMIKDHENEIVRLTEKSRSISNINKRIIAKAFRC